MKLAKQVSQNRSRFVQSTNHNRICSQKISICHQRLPNSIFGYGIYSLMKVNLQLAIKQIIISLRESLLLLRVYGTLVQNAQKLASHNSSQFLPLGLIGIQRSNGFALTTKLIILNVWQILHFPRMLFLRIKWLRHYPSFYLFLLLFIFIIPIFINTSFTRMLRFCCIFTK